MLDPDYLRQLIEMPEGFSINRVIWSEDRNAFCVMVDTPEESVFFVPQNDIIPMQSAAVTITDGADGNKHLRIRLPQLDDLMEQIGGGNHADG